MAFWYHSAKLVAYSLNTIFDEAIKTIKESGTKVNKNRKEDNADQKKRDARK